MNSSQCEDPAMLTSAASGISTIALRKNVVKPNVRPKPGSTLGCMNFQSPAASRAATGVTSRLRRRIAGLPHDQHGTRGPAQQRREPLRQYVDVRDAQDQQL